MGKRVDWGSIRIDIRPQHNTLFIGKWGFIPEKKKFSWISRSDNRTDEILSMAAIKLRNDIDKENNADKPYAGFNVPGVGKLVLIKAGFDFSVKPAPRKK